MATTTPFYPRPRSMLDDGKVRNRATGSPFDHTVVHPAHIDPPGVHERILSAPAASHGMVRSRTDPRLFARRRSGHGGAAATAHRTATLSPLRAMHMGPHASLPVSPTAFAVTLTKTSGIPLGTASFTAPGGAARPATAAAAMPASPPTSGAKKSRRNPANTELRRFYERGDLPCIIDQRGVHNRLAWKVAFDKLDYSHYLPLFFDGLREEEMPYKFIAQQGSHDLLANGGAAILPVVPQLIIPLKNALNTRRTAVVITALEALKWLVTSDVTQPGGPMIGRALVPYYRQLLPIMNIYVTTNKNLGDVTDYGQRKNEVLGDRIWEVLNLLEAYGGEDSLVNIKYLVPVYQSCMRAV